MALFVVFFVDILESEVLPEVLQVILTIGNFLNGVRSVLEHIRNKYKIIIS